MQLFCLFFLNDDNSSGYIRVIHLLILLKVAPLALGTSIRLETWGRRCYKISGHGSANTHKLWFVMKTTMAWNSILRFLFDDVEHNTGLVCQWTIKVSHYGEVMTATPLYLSLQLKLDDVLVHLQVSSWGIFYPSDAAHCCFTLWKEWRLQYECHSRSCL